jgi:hypothetical protein
VRVWLWLPSRWKLPKRRFLLDSTLLPDCWQLTRSLPVDIDVVVVVITVISPTGRGWDRSCWHGWEKHRRGTERRLVEDDGLRARLLACVQQDPVHT